MERIFLRGEIYYADLGTGVGSEQEGCRPVVIVQNDLGNKHSPTVIVAPLSSRMTGRKLPTHCYIDYVEGMKSSSVILTEQLRTIDKSRIRYKVGMLEGEQLKALNEALAVSVGLRRVSSRKMTMNLCGICAENFRHTGKVWLRRTDHVTDEKENGTYCNVRRGYEYEIIYIKERRSGNYGNEEHN